ncbi:hypothetical protein L3Q82_014231, partial [Scortum barcoo]
TVDVSSPINMDTKMFQLRSFVHQRLYTAAEEILGEVEKTITLALYEAEVSRSKEEVESLRHQLDLLRKKPDCSVTFAVISVVAESSSNTKEHGDECSAPLLQENPGPSTPEEANFSAEVPGPSKPNADLDNDNWNFCLVETDFKMPEIKEEQEELGDDGQTQEMVFSSSEIVKSEQDQPETQVLYEMQPVSSDCSAAQSVNNDNEGELANSRGEQTKTIRQKGKLFPGQSGGRNKKNKAALPHDKRSAKNEKGRSFCHLCGKGFQYIGSLMMHSKST